MDREYHVYERRLHDAESKLPRAAFPWNESRDSGRPIRDVEDIRHVMSGGWQQITAEGAGDCGGQRQLLVAVVSGMKMIGSSQVDYKEEVVRRLVVRRV